jgi:glycosyltransferase involved in cell wall biosynthesis
MSREMARNPSIVFVIPTHNQQLDRVSSEIDKNFSDYNYNLLVVNDGSTVKIDLPKNSTVINHAQNLGLAKALISGYKEATKHSADFIVKTDADSEYPIYPIKGVIDSLINSEREIGGIVGLKRSIQSNGVIDWMFNNIMGKIEGNFLIGQPLIQHSPGLHVYKTDIIRSILPDLEKITSKLDLRWGLDIATIKLAVKYGTIICVKIFDHSWKQRRPLEKVYKQAISAIRVMNEMKRETN